MLRIDGHGVAPGWSHARFAAVVSTSSSPGRGCNMRGEGECEFGYGLLELAALLLWAATLVLGVALRLGDFGRAAQHTGDMLVGTSGFAFLAVAFLLMAERPEHTPAVGDRALKRRRCRQFRRMARLPLL